MCPSEKLIRTQKDGSVRHQNFFTGQEAWTLPGRGDRPPHAGIPGVRPSVPPGRREDLCNFCPARYRHTPPEKSRLVMEGGAFVRQERLPPSRIFSAPAEFRRIANLYEIFSYDYWNRNHGFLPGPRIRQWQEAYLDTEEGAGHVRHVLDMKHPETAGSGASGKQPSREELLDRSIPLFAGSHDLVVVRDHLVEDPALGDQPLSSGDLTPEKHAAFIRFCFDALAAIRAENPHLTYVVLFQNWLKPAGASFDHLHKQLVGVDDAGPLTALKLARCAKEKGAFFAFARTLAREGLLIAANDHALAAADTGHLSPAVTVVSRSGAALPEEMTSEECIGLSDLLHACHAAWDRNLPSNEQWCYAPPGQGHPDMPVHVTLEWRLNGLAGFESATGLYINPLSPHAVRDATVDALHRLRREGRVAPLKIGEECAVSPDGMDT